MLKTPNLRRKIRSSLPDRIFFESIAGAKDP